ncbi:hypothetical protein [Prochlorothrix hollandica]|uniref:hypothetical protein n=1 Tax=Prochlorothrix hollandica TaxID=1223 RepID=UPI0033408F39
MTREEDRLVKKLRELVGDDRISLSGPGSGSFFTDEGQEISIEGESKERSFNQVRDRVFRRVEDEVSSIADVAVLLSCEKDDEYDIWLTYLGDTRKNKFAFVGSMPKRVESNSYWAWESSNVGRFEFNPYAGATGGGISISTTPTNHDGAIIGASATGANYQSEGWNGGGDKGGVVTPRWTETLTDYSVTVDTYLSTLCYPLGKYTDVTWEWSDGGGGYALRKVPGDGVTTSSDEKTIGTRWEVEWSYSGGGGNVGVSQEDSPRVVKKMSKPGEDIELEEGKTKVWIVEWEEGREVFLTGEDDILTVSVAEFPTGLYRHEIGAIWYTGGNCGNIYPSQEFWSTSETPLTFTASTWYGGSCGTYYGGKSVTGGSVSFLGPQLFPGFLSSAAQWYGQAHQSSVGDEIVDFYVKVSVNGSEVFSSDKYNYEPNPTVDSYSIDPEDPDPNPPPGYTYFIQVFDEDDIEVASNSASSPIASTTEKIETKRVGFYIKQDGENINGQFDDSGGPLPSGFEDGDEVPEEYRDAEVRAGESIPSVTGETNIITAKIKGWVEIAGKKLGELELDGDEGQSIIESAAYERAIEPYTGPDGRTVYPCYVQKTEEKDSKKSFNKDDGFDLYYITHYVTEDDNGIAAWVPFDFNNPDLSGYLPSPSVNFLYSLFFASIKVEYDPKGILAWGKDIPEEGSNLEEEREDGIDTYGVVYPFAWGFIYGFYGPIKASNLLLNQTISKEDGQTLRASYRMGDWAVRARGRKPRMYAMEPDDTTSGEPFTEADITNLSQRTLNLIENTMSSSFRQGLWGTAPSSINNESEENWRSGSVKFPPPSATGQEVLNRSSVKQRGDDLKNIKVEMADVKALLKAEKKADVRFHLYPEADFTGESTTKTFKMNPIQDVFEGYDDVKIIAAAGIIY